ncbi:2'-5' RNA ligase family protein, partial [Bacillus sp. JJ1764]|uniref:2'-5' RNA ligase family protein n=1 Tax=Bacillus sp. JJ1764 TaxID=3122964 RepID=UPI002FFE73EB
RSFFVIELTEQVSLIKSDKMIVKKWLRGRRSMALTVGIASLLTDEQKYEVLRFWDIFEKDFNSVGVRSFDHPNLGFQGGRCSNISILKEELSKLCTKISPFDFTVDGFGFFEVPSKVVYLQVKKTNEILDVHKKINSTLAKCCEDLFHFYTPENWVPHITLAMDDLSEINFEKFKNKYEHYSPSLKQTFSNLALVEFKENGRVELLYKYEIK